DFPELLDGIDELLREHHLVPRPRESETERYLVRDGAVALDAPARYPALRAGEGLASTLDRVLRRLHPSGRPEPAYAVVVPGRRGPTVFHGLRTRDAAEARARDEGGNGRRVCQVMPDALAVILGRMYDEPELAWDPDLLEDIEQLLKRAGFVH